MSSNPRDPQQPEAPSAEAATPTATAPRPIDMRFPERGRREALARKHLRVLLVGLEPAERLELVRQLEDSDEPRFEVRALMNLEQARPLIERGDCDVALVDWDAQGDGMTTLDRAEIVAAGIPCVALVERGDEPELIPLGNRDVLLRGEIDTKRLAETLTAAVERRHLADEFAKSQEHEHSVATRDRLTGLPNSAAFEEQLRRSLYYAERHDQQIALLHVDIDCFAEANEVLGREVGDSLLITLAERMVRTLRRSDLIARSGGDDFLVMIHARDLEYAPARTAERLLECVSEELIVNGSDTRMSASIGIATHPRDAKDAATLIRRADAAMYQAKSEGRNTYRFYGRSLHEADTRRRDLAARLVGALDRGDLSLHYLPCVDADGVILGAEALLRWEDEVLGTVEPEELVPLAERSGLIHEIGAWAMRQACAAHCEWSAAGFSDLQVSVNVSAAQVRSASLRDAVADAVVETGLRAGALAIEVTEQALLENQEASATLFHELAEIGVPLWLDDFGTETSALSFLNQFPVRALKIDSSCVWSIEPASPFPRFVDAILAVANQLSLDVIAEGVQNAHQRDALRERGCTQMQGFHFSEPLSGDALLEVLRSGRPLGS